MPQSRTTIGELFLISMAMNLIGELSRVLSSTYDIILTCISGHLKRLEAQLSSIVPRIGHGNHPLVTFTADLAPGRVI